MSPAMQVHCLPTELSGKLDLLATAGNAVKLLENVVRFLPSLTIFYPVSLVSKTCFRRPNSLDIFQALVPHLPTHSFSFPQCVTKGESSGGKK